MRNSKNTLKKQNLKNKVTKKNTKKVDTNRFCKISANTFSKFEDEYEKSEIFIKKGMHTKRQVEQNLIKLIKEGSRDPLRPQDDFYTVTNDVWIKNAELTDEQKYIIQLDDFRLVQFKVYKDLDNIIKEHIKNNNDTFSKELKNFYESTKKSITKHNFNTYCKNYILQLDELRKNKSNLWKLLTLLNKNEMIRSGSPLSFINLPDEKNSKILSPHILPVHLSLSDLLVYVDDGKDSAYKKKIKSKYFSYIQKLSRVELEDKTLNNNINPQHVFDIECKLFTNFGCTSVKEDSSDGYNKVYLTNSIKKYNFDWNTYAKELGYATCPDFFVTSSLNYLKCTCETLLEEWNSDTWRSYWIYLFMKQITRNYDETNMLYFNFFTKYLQGQELMPNVSITGVAYMSLAFNSFFTNQYIEKYQRREMLDYVSNLAHDLLVVFKRTIKNNVWLSPKTKQKALLKLKHIKMNIGSSKLLEKDPILGYDTNDFWGNMNKIFEWRANKLIENTGKKVINLPELDFSQSPAKYNGKQAYIVNAFYTPNENSIYIPLAYIQKPFVDLDERGIEYNLSHVGFTIGHELSHCLDDWGSQYDENGNLNNWWNDRDRNIFKRKQKNVIAQYEAFALQDGIKFDAIPSIGEDLADISGLAICEEYLRDFQDKNEDIILIRILSFKVFFVYYAFQMRQKIKRKALNAQLHTNPHPLDKYRTNVPLSRLELFRDLYEIQKGDGMYWPSTDKIW